MALAQPHRKMPTARKDGAGMLLLAEDRVWVSWTLNMGRQSRAGPTFVGQGAARPALVCLGSC